MDHQPKLTPVSAVPRLFRSPISTAARTREHLIGLGRKPDEVALNLFNAGCFVGRGRPEDTDPLAVYLLRSDLKPYAVTVDSEHITLHFTDSPDDVTRVEHTDATAMFVARLDGGWYRQMTTKAVTA